MEFIKLLLNEQNVRMQYEIALMLFVIILPILKLRDKKYLACCLGAAFIFFIYIHRTLLPFIISGMYFFLLAGIVSVITEFKPAAFIKPLRHALKTAYSYLDRGCLPFTAVIMLILLIQLCRLNISIDYDSLRYGLRSDVLLTDGTISGFFKSIGLVNTVYTYPKGFELITMPLLFGDTYGYVLCFNVWILIAVIMLAGNTAGELCRAVLSADKDAETVTAFVSAMTALIPGITNMAVTAKTDLITLLMQLIFIYCVIRYLRLKSEGFTEEGKSLTGMGIGALILSLSFKPTSIIFSSVLGLAALLYFSVRKIKLGADAKSARFLILSCIFTGIMTFRTLSITGQPFTSVFTGLFSRLGMKLKYPFREQAMVYTDETAAFTEKVADYVSRLFHFLLCPAGEDMEHVFMAWGGFVFVIMLAASIVFASGLPERINEMNSLNRIKKAAVHEADAYSSKMQTDRAEYVRYGMEFSLYSLYAVLFISLLSLWFLYQVDGNYFELLYALAVICGGSAVFIRLCYENSELCKDKKKYISSNGKLGLISPVLITAVMVYFTAFTGWNGANGFTPIDLINRGYYNHTELFGIKNPLGWDKHERIVAFAYEPECYKLEGRVESFVDIDGSGGNVYLTDTKLNIFKEYLSWADIDYIYADLDYLNDELDQRHTRAKELFIYLLEDGDFEHVVLEENSSTLLYCRIDKERAGVDWEVPMSAEQSERTAEQLEYFKMITQ